MNKNRLEAFSDGVIAVLITIMVLDLHPPHTTDWSALLPLLPIFLTYILSFIYIGIYWNNHHHMLHAATQVNGKILWANLHLLFWLSLVPFVSGWMGENNFSKWPTIFYGIVLIMNAFAYYLLMVTLLKHEGKGSLLAKAIGKDWKGKISPAIYAVAIAIAWFNPCISFILYAVVAAIWFIPDRRIENKVLEDQHN